MNKNDPLNKIKQDAEKIGADCAIKVSDIIKMHVSNTEMLNSSLEEFKTVAELVNKEFRSAASEAYKMLAPEPDDTMAYMQWIVDGGNAPEERKNMIAAYLKYSLGMSWFFMSFHEELYRFFDGINEMYIYSTDILRCVDISVIPSEQCFIEQSATINSYLVMLDAVENNKPLPRRFHALN